MGHILSNCYVPVPWWSVGNQPQTKRVMIPDLMEGENPKWANGGGENIEFFFKAVVKFAIIKCLKAVTSD